MKAKICAKKSQVRPFTGALCALWMAMLMGGCAAESDSASLTSGPPSSLQYSENPARYPYGEEITPNLLTGHGSKIQLVTINTVLPEGLELDPLTGTISGTPESVTPAQEFVITARNAHGSNFIRLLLEITDLPPQMTYSGSKVLNLAVNVPLAPVAPDLEGGATISCAAIPPLPLGISLSDQCEISGTPIVGQAETVHLVSAINSGGASTLEFTVTVNDLPPVISFVGGPFVWGRGIAVDPLLPASSGGVVTACAVAPELPSGLVLAKDCSVSGVPLEVVPAADYLFTASNVNGVTGTAIANIAVVDVLPEPTFSGSPFSFVKDKAITTIVPENTGGAIDSCVSAPELPAGLSLSAQCAISGKPTQVVAVTADYTITATNSEGSASVVISLAVTDIPPKLNYFGGSFNFTATQEIIPIVPLLNTGGDITSCASAPALPAGLSLGNTTCIISGTPAVGSATKSYQITASNSGGSAKKTISITVHEVAPKISIAGSPFSFTRNAAITPVSASNDGGMITACSADPGLPSGLSLSTSCAISGTPSALAAAANYTITASNSAGTSSVSVSIEVKDPAPSISYSGSPFSFTRSVAISTQTPTSTGGPIESCTVNPALPAGLSLSSTTCALSGIPTAITPEADYTVSASNASGTGTAQITMAVNDVAPVISYPLSPFSFTKDQAIAPVSVSNTGGAVVSCLVAPALPAGLDIAPDCTISGAPSSLSAAAPYTITAENSGGTSATTISVAVKDAPPQIAFTPNSFSFERAVVVDPATPANSGGPIASCSVSPALPAGLALNPADCTLSGTPSSVSAAANYTVTATNTGGSSSAVITIEVIDRLPDISYQGGPFVYTKGSAITPLSVTNGGGVISSCSISPALPGGLSLSSSCTISGTPGVLAPAADYTVTATNSAGGNSTLISVAVIDVAPDISYAGFPVVYTVGTPIAPVSVTNTGGPIVSCASLPVLPAGLTLSQSCQISGTPSIPVVQTDYEITATNTGGTSDFTVRITVNDVAPSLNFAGGPYSYDVNAAITPLVPSNAGGSVVSCTPAPALPAGLTLSANCTISGTPTVITPSATYTLTASNSGGSQDVPVTIEVTDAAPVFSYSGGPFSFTRNVAIAPLTPVSSGGVILSCSSAPLLPAGLDLSDDCVISGPPGALAGSATYTITGTNGGGSSTANVTLAVVDAPPAIDYIPTSYSFTYTRNVLMDPLVPNSTGGPIANCTISPALPAGLAIHATTCAISGTPSALSAAKDYTVTATNTGGSSSAVISIAIIDALADISYAGGPFVYTKGTSIAPLAPANTGGAIVSCSASPALPGGLSLSNGCVITGTPGVLAAATDHTITATNSAGANSTAISIRVNDVPPDISYAGSPFTYFVGSVITPVSVANGGGAIVSCSSNPVLPAGLSLSAQCQISGTPSTPAAQNDYVITASNTGGTSDFMVTITVNDGPPNLSFVGSPYSFPKDTAITPVVPSNSGGTPVTCTPNPALPAGLSLAASCTISGTPGPITPPAAYTLTATNSGGSQEVVITIGITDALPVISYAGGPFAFTKDVEIADLVPISSGGGIVSCGVAPALPAGLNLSDACVITGTPTTLTGSASYTVTATNEGGLGFTSVTLAVVDVPPAIDYIPTSYSFVYTRDSEIDPLTPNSTAGPIVNCGVAPALPTGLSINPANCTISGTPTQAKAATNYTVTASNSGGSSQAIIEITVIDLPPDISYPGSPYTVNRNQAITPISPANTGGAPSSCLIDPQLPAGLSISGACVISGTPAVLSPAADYTVTASNQLGAAPPVVLSLAVVDGPPAISYPESPFVFPRTIEIAPKSPTNTGGPIVSCESVPELPSGLSLSAGCVISGTPTTITGSANYTITATNTGGTSQAVVNITVPVAPPAISYAGSPFTYERNSAIAPLSVSNTGGAIVNCGVAPALPMGLAIADTCQITGTPTTLAAAADYTITATNAGGSGQAVINIAVNDVAPDIAYNPASHVFTVRETISNINVSNAGGVITGCSSDPALPAGLSLSATCVISGEPSVVTAATDYTITASNTGGTSQAVVNIRVADLPKILFYGLMALNGTNNGTAPLSQNIWKMSVDGGDRVPLTQNSNSGLDSIFPSVTANGSTVLSASRRALDGSTNGTATGSHNIWKTTSSGGSPEAMTSYTNSDLDSDYAVFSADGTKVVFASKRPLLNSTSTLSYNIWFMNADGSGLKELIKNTNGGLDSLLPVFDPNNSNIVYFHSKTERNGAVNGSAAPCWNVWRVLVDTTARTNISNQNIAGRDSVEAAVSVNGTLVYASKERFDGTAVSSYNIWTYDGSKTAVTQNKTAGLDSVEPQFSPDGAEIVFASKMNVNGSAASSYNIWKMSVNGDNLVALTTNNAANLDSRAPRFSPDGNKIIFTSKMNIGANPASSSNIWIMNSDGTGQTPLTGNTNAGLDSFLSPGRVWFQP